MLSSIDVKYFKMAVGLNNIGKTTDVDITAKCPVCGDSRKNASLKRLHLYNKGDVTNINCFNGDCAVSNKTVYSFLRDFYPALFPKYQKDTFGETMSQLANGGDVFGQFKSTKEDEQKDIVEEPVEVLVQDLSPFFSPMTDETIDYLSNRGIQYQEKMFGQWYYGHQDLQIGDVLYKLTGAIIVPLYYRDVMYGFYSRSIHEKNFITYMNDANIGYKLWNWFNVNKDEPVYIFEGIFDAISSGETNIIAAIGAKIPDERIKELKEPIFVYDNDRTGLINSLAMAKKGFTVYVQPDNVHQKDMNAVKCETDINISELINNNLFRGISAEVRIKSKL